MSRRKKPGPKRRPGPKPKGYRPWRGLPTRLRQEIMLRDDGVCRYCGNPATEIDHVLPHAHGGKDSADNLVATCHRCNHIKNARPHFVLDENNVLRYGVHVIGPTGLFGAALWSFVSPAYAHQQKV